LTEVVIVDNFDFWQNDISLLRSRQSDKTRAAAGRGDAEMQAYWTPSDATKWLVTEYYDNNRRGSEELTGLIEGE
jgi:hypothetical protein